MPDVEVTVTTTPIDVYINSDPTVYIDTATQGIQGPSAPTGDFISRSETGVFVNRSETGVFVSRSETGLFYPASNPSGFVTSTQLNDFEVSNSQQINQLSRTVVYITGNQIISGQKYFDNLNLYGLYVDAPSFINRKYTLVTAPGLFYLYNMTGVSNARTFAIEFSNSQQVFNLYGSGQSAIKLYEKSITGFDNINSKNFVSDYNGYFGWFNPSLPTKGSRFTSKDGGGYWVTLDRADGTAENLNVAGNLQVGSGSGIRAQRLYVRGDALITEDLTVNTSGNFLSGLFVNRNPVLTGTTGTQSQINNLSTSLSGSYVTLGTNQTITGNKIFDSNVFIKNLTVTGTQTIINTETINLASNFLNLNATGGVRDGGLFINLSSNSGSGAYLGWDIPSNTWRFGSGLAGTDLATLDYIASQSWVTGRINDPTIVRTTGIQTITDYKSFGGIDASEATVIQNFKVGYSPDYLIDADGTNFSINILNVQGVGLVLNLNDFYLGGPSGNINFYNGIITGFGNIYQNSYRVVDSSQTGSFLTNASNVVYLTGNQTVSGLKTFANNLEVSGYGNFSDNLYINNSRVATEAELTKKMIAFAIALG